MAKVYGYWDCPYCSTKGIRGDHRECPNCGKPRGTETKFYMKSGQKEYVEQKDEHKYGNGADWLCSFCNSLNSNLNDTCNSCGATKADSEKNYFNMNSVTTDVHYNTHNAENIGVQQSDSEYSTQNDEKIGIKRSKYVSYATRSAILKFGIIAISIIAAISLIVYLVTPREIDTTINTISWEYTIDIEEPYMSNESDWYLPSGGELQYTREEIHHYDHVFVGTNSRTVTRSEEVYDGDEISYSYRDNGDGTFEEIEIRTPKYHTEYYDDIEYYDVYEDVPVYETKYYYQIERWRVGRKVTTAGVDKSPYWGECTLVGRERKGSSHETYTITFNYKDKLQVYDITKSQWSDLSVGDKVHLKIDKISNKIIEVEIKT